MDRLKETFERAANQTLPELEEVLRGVVGNRMEAAVEAADGPEQVVWVPAAPNWTLLDRGPDHAVALVGTDDGRIFMAISTSGGWRDGDYRDAGKLDTKKGRNWREVAWRCSYDRARRVPVAYASGRWSVGPGRNLSPDDAGRPGPVINQEEFEASLDAMGAELAALVAGTEDPDERAKRCAAVLKMVSRWSFDRAWKERGFGVM